MSCWLQKTEEVQELLYGVSPTPTSLKASLAEVVADVYPHPALVEQAGQCKEASLYLFGVPGIGEASVEMGIAPTAPRGMARDEGSSLLLASMKNFLSGAFLGCKDVISQLGNDVGTVFLLIVSSLQESTGEKSTTVPPARKKNSTPEDFFIEAMVTFHPRPKGIYLSWLLVSHPWQGKRVGTFLLCLIQRLVHECRPDFSYGVEIYTQSNLADQEDGNVGALQRRLFFFAHLCFVRCSPKKAEAVWSNLDPELSTLRSGRASIIHRVVQWKEEFLSLSHITTPMHSVYRAEPQWRAQEFAWNSNPNDPRWSCLKSRLLDVNSAAVRTLMNDYLPPDPEEFEEGKPYPGVHYEKNLLWGQTDLTTIFQIHSEDTSGEQLFEIVPPHDYGDDYWDWWSSHPFALCLAQVCYRHFKNDSVPDIDTLAFRVWWLRQLLASIWWRLASLPQGHHYWKDYLQEYVGFSLRYRIEEGIAQHNEKESNESTTIEGLKEKLVSPEAEVMCFEDVRRTIRFYCTLLLNDKFHHDFDDLEMGILSNCLGIRLFHLHGESNVRQESKDHVAWAVRLEEFKLPKQLLLEKEETSDAEETSDETSAGNVLIVAKFLDAKVAIIAPGQKEVAESSLLDNKFKYWKKPRKIRDDTTSDEEDETKNAGKSSDKGKESQEGAAGGEKTS